MNRPATSIRRRLLVGTAGGMALVLFLGTLTLIAFLRREFRENFDVTLLGRARTLAALCEMDEGAFEFAYTGDELSEFGEDGGQYFQLWSAEGVVIARSPSLVEEDLDHAGLEPEAWRFRDAVLPDGRPGRFVEIGFRPRPDEAPLWSERPSAGAPEEPDQAPEATDRDTPVSGITPGEGAVGAQDPDVAQAGEEGGDENPAPPAVLVLGRERESLDRSLVRASTIVGGAFALCLALVLLVLGPLTARALTPLNELSRQVSRIDERSLDHRIVSGTAALSELRPIEEQLNRLLERLEAAFRREREFSSNVAHELRTPLAELRSLREVAEMLPEDSKELKEFFADTAGITRRMERTVRSLLNLARMEAGKQAVEPQAVDLEELLQGLDLPGIAAGAGKRALLREGDCRSRISSDPGLLEEILRNLLENAFAHGPERTDVILRCGIRDGALALEIENEAPDLVSEDLERLALRFWRKDSSRTGDRHAGLGLSLVAQRCRLLDLGLDFELRDGRLLVRVSGIPLEE